MSLLPQSIRSTYCYASRLHPIASSSRLGYAAFRSSTSIRSAHAIPRPDTASGFEGVPAPAYNGSVSDVKGKQKEAESPSKSSAPRRKIQSKKAAITMVSHTSFYQMMHTTDHQTPGALDRLRALVDSPTEPKLLRIGVKTRGCAGMAYHLDYVPPPGGRFDEVVEQDGVKVLIDSKALFSIIGSTMDWRDNRLSAGFVFDK